MKTLILIIMCLFIFGCSKTIYYGLKPIPLKKWDSTTDTRPLFKWETCSKAGVTYDLIISEYIQNGQVSVPGKTIYYIERIKKTEHRIDLDLEKGKTYLWSVRVRDGNKAERWSAFNYSGPGLRASYYPYTITILDNDSKPDYYKELQ